MPLGAFAIASRALDFGAEGIIAPMINTVADAKAFVGAAKYPPLGERSWGPTRAMTLAGIADPKAYLREANASTRHARDDRDQDRDGQSRRDRGGAGHRRAVRRALRSVDRADATAPSSIRIPRPSRRRSTRSSRPPNKAGKIAGLYCANAERAVACAKRGIRFLAVGSDLGFLRAGAAAQLKTLKG